MGEGSREAEREKERGRGRERERVYCVWDHWKRISTLAFDIWWSFILRNIVRFFSWLANYGSYQKRPLNLYPSTKFRITVTAFRFRYDVFKINSRPSTKCLQRSLHYSPWDMLAAHSAVRNLIPSRSIVANCTHNNKHILIIILINNTVIKPCGAYLAFKSIGLANAVGAPAIRNIYIYNNNNNNKLQCATNKQYRTNPHR